METKEKKYPEPVVGALIVNNEGKILLAKSHKWKGKWAIFGGHVEEGEKLEDTVRREVKEETGLDVEVIAELGFSDSVFSKNFSQKKHFIFIDYLCLYSGKDDSDVTVNDEYDGEYRWFGVEEALKNDLAEGVKIIISEYKKYLEKTEYLNSWKRCQADFENYRKMQSEERRQLSSFASENMILQLLPILDNFHASTDHIPEEQKDGAWVVGIMHIQKQLETFLKDNGVEEIETKEGDKFDPEIHEAIHSDSNDTNKHSNDANKIKKVVSKGYKIGGKVIRAVRVIVN